MGLAVPKSTENKLPGWVKTNAQNGPIMIVGNI